MKIVFTLHAKQRMIERKISVSNVEETIQMPEYTVSKGNKTEAHKRINNKLLKVIYLKGENYIKVITVVWK